MKKFNTLQIAETSENEQESINNPLPKEKARDLGGAILEISEKLSIFRKSVNGLRI